MITVAELLAGNASYAPTHVHVADPRPRRRSAIVTCMDARLDVPAAVGLSLGAATVIRNAGGRVTDDVLRSLAVAVHLLEVDSVVVVHHTGCGIAGVDDDVLRARTGAELDFHPIVDHPSALRRDVATVMAADFLGPVGLAAGLLFDVVTGEMTDVCRFERGDWSRLHEYVTADR